MRNKASALLKRIIATLSSMAKSKTLALKSKTRAIKTRLIILSLLSKKRFLMRSLSHSIQQKKSSISHKLHALLGHHDKHSEDEDDEEDQSQAIALNTDSNVNAMTHVPNPHQTRVDLLKERHRGCLDEAGEEKDDKYLDLTHVPSPHQTRADLLEERHRGCLDEAGEEKDDKYPDRTHSIFDSEDLDFEDPGGSLIDLAKSSKEGAGEEFNLEDEIDHVADLFIKRFHRNMWMQKQLSLKRQQEMQQSGA